MVDVVRGGLPPTTNSVQLTIPPPGLKNHGTSSAARPDAPSCPPPRNSDQTETTVLTKPDRWIQAKEPCLTQLGCSLEITCIRKAVVAGVENK